MQTGCEGCVVTLGLLPADKIRSTDWLFNWVTEMTFPFDIMVFWLISTIAVLMSEEKFQFDLMVW